MSRVHTYTRERTELWEQTSSTGRTYQISVARPKEPPPASGYPVLYVLDADTAFLTLADTVRMQEKMFGPAVVVGIGYASEEEMLARRTLDLTPSTDAATLPPNPKGWGEFGGADAFLDFLLDELRPSLAQTLRIDSKRQALFGHSLGGLFVLHTLFTRPESFQTYIAGSPSIWWGQKVILKSLPGFQAQQSKTATPRRLLITVGEFEDRISLEERKLWPIDFQTDPDELVRSHAMVRNAATLADALRPLGGSGLEVEFALFSGETHCSVIPAYLARGARFTLGAWCA